MNNKKGNISKSNESSKQAQNLTLEEEIAELRKENAELKKKLQNVVPQEQTNETDQLTRQLQATLSFTTPEKSNTERNLKKNICKFCNDSL